MYVSKSNSVSSKNTFHLLRALEVAENAALPIFYSFFTYTLFNLFFVSFIPFSTSSCPLFYEVVTIT